MNSSFIFNFILGALGMFFHIGVKFVESTQKNPDIKITLEDYLKHNQKRIITSIISFLIIYFGWVLSLTTKILPDPIVLFINSLNLNSNNFVWLFTGYFSDSIIRNLSKIVKEIKISGYTIQIDSLVEKFIEKEEEKDKK